MFKFKRQDEGVCCIYKCTRKHDRYEYCVNSPNEYINHQQNADDPISHFFFLVALCKLKIIKRNFFRKIWFPEMSGNLSFCDLRFSYIGDKSKTSISDHLYHLLNINVLAWRIIKYFLSFSD